MLRSIFAPVVFDFLADVVPRASSPKVVKSFMWNRDSWFIVQVEGKVHVRQELCKIFNKIQDSVKHPPVGGKEVRSQFSPTIAHDYF